MSANALDPPSPRANRTELKKRAEVYFHDTVVRYQPNGIVSAGAVLQPPPSLHSDRESSTTLSSIWDIEVQVEQHSPYKDISQTKEARKEKKAPLVHFRRSHAHLDDRGKPSVKLCSKSKARDNSSCEISICEINSCHIQQQSQQRKASVGFRSLPSTSSILEDCSQKSPSSSQLSKTSTADSQSKHKLKKTRTLPTQQSVESSDSYTTTDTQTKQDKSSSQVPIATALFVATCLGTPAIALTGLKLGMFAAVGGGIMGFATGKMFAEHEEKQAMAKGEFSNGDIPSHIKRKKTIKRIQEWEKFETNCQILRELDDDKICKISDMQKQKRTISVGNLNKEFKNKRSNLRKAKSVSYSHQLSP